MARSSSPSLPKVATRLPSKTTAWFLLSLAIAVLYSLPALYIAFSGDYVVQDDARQHVFWMQRFMDPTLFPNDLFADYFQSVAPWGYTTLYRMGVSLGLGLWTVNKLLPVLINLVSAAYTFGTVTQLVPIPLAGFVSVIFLNQTLIERDDVVSATPAAFFYPLFLAFLYYLLKRSVVPCVVTIVLLGLFYPQGVLIMSGILGLRILRWRQGQLWFSQTSADYWLWGMGSLAALGVLLPYLFKDSAYGSVLTAAQGREMFALSFHGWSRFFADNFVDYWLFGQRSGFLPTEWEEGHLSNRLQILLTLAIPFLLAFPGRSRLAREATPRIRLLWEIVIASTACFLAAHLLLFKLHLPNRYTEHSFRILVALGIGVAVALWLDRLQPSQIKRVGIGLTLVLSTWAIAPILMHDFDSTDSKLSGNYLQGEFPQLYAYLQQQPKDISIASLTEETNNLPSFTQRSLFVGGEGYTLPYHLDFYHEVKQRTIDLINAQYSIEPSIVQAFLAQYPIDFWLIDQDMFTLAGIEESKWLQQYLPETTAPQKALLSGQPTVLEVMAETCTTLKVENLQVLDADCLQQTLRSTS